MLLLQTEVDTTYLRCSTQQPSFHLSLVVQSCSHFFYFVFSLECFTRCMLLMLNTHETLKSRFLLMETSLKTCFKCVAPCVFAFYKSFFFLLKHIQNSECVRRCLHNSDSVLLQPLQPRQPRHNIVFNLLTSNGYFQV